MGKPFENVDFKNREVFRKTKFRDTRNLTVKNKIMLALLYAFDYKTKELADYCGVHHTTVEHWIYRDVYPGFISRQKLIYFFGIDEDLLFGSYVNVNSPGIKRVIKAQGTRLHFHGNTHQKINKPILYGLIWVYRLSTKTLSEELGIKYYLISKILYSDYEPRLNIKIRFELLFDIPHRVLFMKNMRVGSASDK